MAFFSDSEVISSNKLSELSNSNSLKLYIKKTRNGSTKVVRFKPISIWLPKWNMLINKPYKPYNLTSFK